MEDYKGFTDKILHLPRIKVENPWRYEHFRSHVALLDRIFGIDLSPGCCFKDLTSFWAWNSISKCIQTRLHKLWIILARFCSLLILRNVPRICFHHCFLNVTRNILFTVRCNFTPGTRCFNYYILKWRKKENHISWPNIFLKMLELASAWWVL